MACYRYLSKRVSKRRRPLTLSNVNRSLVDMESTLRSRVYINYMQHYIDLKEGYEKPFDELLAANIGDAQRFGQPSLTFLRQVLALCLCPTLGDRDEIKFPQDVKSRAKHLLAQFPNGSVGSLTDPQGLWIVRKHVSEYIRERDGGTLPSEDDIFLQDCSKSIDAFLNTVNGRKAGELQMGILVPVPTYPLYPAVLSKYGMRTVAYHLNEENDWEPDVRELKRVVDRARCVCRPTGMVVINPGNPTGSVLTRRSIEDIIRFCYEEELFVIADEVYQEIVYGPDVEFTSFKKVKHGLRGPYPDVELVSVHSASKGFIGECGLRGGYLELDGFHRDVKRAFLKVLELYRNANPAGQIAVDVLVRPPAAGDPSCASFQREKTAILARLTEKATLVVEWLNAIEGIRVKPLRGGLFAYAVIENMPAAAVQKAHREKMDPSLLWALELLDATGVAVTPGSSFLQKPGSYHFRVTIVPPLDVIHKVVKHIGRFHPTFLKRYA